ncbi:phage tail protein [Xylella fastidiosa]|uniref:Tail protein n=1 Tax=Xylella fastidiosa subsp. sandyi Ann-1 TaxID=155920 RepID=A0A060H3V2_XYLFS|nr:phage tail protein [Xylella fastidiosa]AIC09975.1 tail protein [Xylella fastidiosa subsp. sandyi Ann-1]UIX80268.1 phage tail protein [Xylella fastidiosa subsp. sandyi]
MIRQTLWSDVAAPLQNAFQTNNSGNRPVLMMLGGYTFSLASLVYQELARVNEYRWAAIERYGQRDARQYTGPGDESIELPGIAYPDWQGQRASLEELRALAAQGKPLQLIDSNGVIHGWYVIERIEERQSDHHPNGTPRRIEFTLALQRVNDDHAVEATP